MAFSKNRAMSVRALFMLTALGLAAHAQAVTVDIQVTKTWSSGYNADMVITNDGAAVSGWTLAFNLGHGIKTLSRATLSGSDPYTVTSLSYSADIPSGGHETLGYTGAAAFSSSGLKNCVFNGKACTLLVNGKPIGGSTSSAGVSASSKASAASSKPPAVSSSSSKPAAVSSSSASQSKASSASSRSSSSAASTILGRFDTSKDLLLAFFDTKPDPDDIHSQAGLGTILKHPTYANVKYYALTGTVGIQGGTFIDASSVMSKAFPDHWQSAYSSSERKASLTKTVSLAYDVLAKGGKVWVQEAGQSNFSADMVRALKAQDSSDSKVSFNTRTQIVVVQHSSWNEDKTSSSDLSYVKAETDYRKIADGNSYGNGTTSLNTKSQSTTWSKAKKDAAWERLTTNAKVGSIWTAARSLANNKGSNPEISAGGIDFSDTVEALYIFGKEKSLGGVDDYMDAFLQ